MVPQLSPGARRETHTVCNRIGLSWYKACVGHSGATF